MADINLVWANCSTFNAEGSWIDKACTNARKLLVKLWRKAKLPGAEALEASTPQAEAIQPASDFEPESSKAAILPDTEQQQNTEEQAKRNSKGQTVEDKVAGLKEHDERSPPAEHL